jgi:HK97 family phage major capsid protein
MKNVFKVLLMICMIGAFAVAGSMINADPIIAGAIGLAGTQLPMVFSFAAAGVTIKEVTGTSREYLLEKNRLLEILNPIQAKEVKDWTEEDRKVWKENYDKLGSANDNYVLALQKENSQRMAAAGGRTLSEGDRRDIEKYSFRKAILSIYGHKLDGVEAEMHQEAVKESRDFGFGVTGVGVPYLLLANKSVSKRASTGQNVTTVGDGGYLVQEEPFMYFEALRNKIVLPGMGARFITGLVGDLPLVEGGSFTSSWLAEDAEDTTTKAAFEELVMKPNRQQVTGAFTYQLLKQSSPDIDKLVTDMLIEAHAQGYQNAAINGSGTPPTPRGILNKVGIGSVVIGTNGGAPIWKTIVDLETEVAIDNAEGNSMYYLTNAKVRGKLKQTEKTSGNAQYIWVGNEMNGYPVVVTNAVPANLTKGNQSELCSAIIFGDFSKLILASWGGLDIIKDPFTKKNKAEVEIAVISYGDVGIMQPEAFAACKDATTV